MNGLCSSLLPFLLGVGPALVQIVPVIACGNAVPAWLFVYARKKRSECHGLHGDSGCGEPCLSMDKRPGVDRHIKSGTGKTGNGAVRHIFLAQGITALTGGMLALVITARLEKATIP